MTNPNSLIAQILRTKPISVYLEQKGIKPVKLLPGKLLYRCPLPDHKETKPSFVVFTNGEFENFYCFGCQAKYHIIHLVARMEHLSIKEAISRLGNGVEITYFDETQFNATKWSEQYGHFTDELDISDAMLMMSSIVRLYEEGVGYDKDEMSKIDEYWQTIDNDLLTCDFEGIMDASAALRQILKLRREKYEVLRKEKLRKQLSGSGKTH